jgi:guanine nucleotide-binding protein subunit alpha
LEGGKDFGKATEFIQTKFMSQNKTAKKQVYSHVTCATDTSKDEARHAFSFATDNVMLVWNAVRDILLRSALSTMVIGGQSSLIGL